MIGYSHLSQYSFFVGLRLPAVFRTFVLLIRPGELALIKMPFFVVVICQFFSFYFMLISH